MSATKTGTTLTTDCIDLVDKDNCWCILFRLSKEVAYTCSTDTNEHLYEIRSRYGVERNARFACNSTSKEGLTCSRRAIEKNTLRDLCSHILIFLRFSEKILDLTELLNCLISASHIGEGICWVLFIVELRLRTTKLEDLISTIGISHKEHKQEANKEEWTKAIEKSCEE